MPKIITLPKNLSQAKELILMPRSEYEKLLRASKAQTKLDAGIEESMQEIKQGKVIGPFSNPDDLMKSFSSKS